MLNKGRAIKAANATFILLLFFNTYGLAFRFLIKLNVFRIEHYTLLPLYILTAVYATWIITKLTESKSQTFWKITTLIMGVLVVLNLGTVIPQEIHKTESGRDIKINSTANVQNVVEKKDYPDIYYIVFDEFAGFDAMIDYWGNDRINDFVNFLKTNNFFVAEKSHAGTVDTLQIMATRLNYQEEYPLEAKYIETYYNDIANNRVMSYLKSLGYTTAVFDETKASFAYPAAKPINADYQLEFNPDSAGNLGILFDDYGLLVADNTMLLAFSDLYKINNPVLNQHRGMIYYTLNKVGNLDIPSPKFVYVHLMLPHMPFMFDASGNMTDPSVHQNWNYYLGNYMFAVKILEKMVLNITSAADPSRSQVIILQSDHGARNKQTGHPDSVILDDYPEEFKTLIMNALRLPGCDTTDLPQDINPINTFPIVFNCYFNAQIPLK